jgi:hypothetical protein
VCVFPPVVVVAPVRVARSAVSSSDMLLVS